VTGIEPALSAWEADVLPLNYTRARPVAGSLLSAAIDDAGQRCSDIVPEPARRGRPAPPAERPAARVAGGARSRGTPARPARPRRPRPPALSLGLRHGRNVTAASAAATARSCCCPPAGAAPGAGPGYAPARRRPPRAPGAPGAPRAPGAAGAAAGNAGPIPRKAKARLKFRRVRGCRAEGCDSVALRPTSRERPWRRGPERLADHSLRRN
jgi:hypothetical protein